MDLNCFISASGVVTFKKSLDLASTFKDIPNNRILVETDAPYLAPEPLRGKTNEPSYIIHTVKFLSDLKKITRTLSKMSFKERSDQACIGRDRADLMVPGCAILEAICCKFPIGRLRVADRGVREGILFKLIQKLQR